MRRLGRVGPVGRFVATVAALVVALSVLGVTGAVAPKIDATRSTGISAQPTFAYHAVQVVNRGTLPVEVRSATWPSSGLSEPQLRTAVTSAEAASSPAMDGLAAFQTSQPLEPFELQGGEVRTFVVTGWIRCAAGERERTITTGDLELEVAPVAGPARRAVLEVGSSGGSDATLVAPCPPAAT